jgi:hypothetical protein
MSKKKDLVAVSSGLVVFMTLFIPAALRYGIGTDYNTYVQWFYAIGAGVKKNNEWGYRLLNKFLYDYDFDVQWFFVIMSFFTLYFLFIATPRKSFYIIIALYYLFFYFQLFNLVRQSLIITIGYYAFQLVDRKKYVRSLLMIFIAFLFHQSACIYLIIFIIPKITKKKAIVLFMLITIIYLNPLIIIRIIYNVIMIHTPYALYITDKTQNQLIVKNSGLGVISRHLLLLLLLVVVKDEKNRKYFSLLLVSFFLDLLGSSVVIFQRISLSFFWGWFPMIDHINTSSRGNNKKIILSIVYCWCILMILSYLTSNNATDFEYRSVFDK